MTGYAVTAHVETMTRMSPLDGEPFHDLFASIATSPKPAVVLLQDIGGLNDFAAHCGELMATIFQRLGAVGVVSDCGVRDLPEVRALGMRYFARGPVASHAHIELYALTSPCTSKEWLFVRPGEIIQVTSMGCWSCRRAMLRLFNRKSKRYARPRVRCSRTFEARSFHRRVSERDFCTEQARRRPPKPIRLVEAMPRGILL